MTRTCDINFTFDKAPDCILTIIVSETDIDKYNIKYNFRFSNGVEVNSLNDFITSLEIKSNPFHNNKMIGTRYYSGIDLIKNQLTTAMVEMLLMSETELSQNTGTITPKEYKKGIIMSIPNFSE